MTLGAEAPGAVVVKVEKISIPVVLLESVFSPASVLAFLINQGNSVTAVAPDYSNERKESGLAIAA